ncbi:MAG: hypothetical protein PHD07_03115 [Bacteroidales bacterium]|nr:hypothetical protein [Bacteroidales bacterium]MDD3200955.1 hypothetical protein [Bacteroidales bacterium]
MDLLVISIILLGLCFILMSVRVLLIKNGTFIDGEITRNEELRRLGITCAKEEELKLWGKQNRKRHPLCSDIGCEECIFHTREKELIEKRKKKKDS